MRFSLTYFLIPHYIRFPLFAFPSAGAVDKLVLPVDMQSVNFSSCLRLTGTAESGMSEVHIYLICFWWFSRHASSFLICIFPPLFAFPSAGAVDKLLFPDGMQHVSFNGCHGLTGTADG